MTKTRIDVEMLPCICAECKHTLGYLIGDKGKGSDMIKYLSDNQIYVLCARCKEAIVNGGLIL